MTRYVAGDKGSFEELFHRYEERAYAFFVRRTGSAEQARDLYQELFLRVHRSRGDFDAERSFAPWLFQIARRLLVDDRRLAYRSHEVPIDDYEGVAESLDGEERFGDCERLDQALAALSGEERRVLLAAKLEGVAYPELAAQLGKSAEAVRKMASRAVQRLRAAPLVPASVPPE